MSEHKQGVGSSSSSEIAKERRMVAVMIMQGLLANEQVIPLGMGFDADYLARRAYRIADAIWRAQ